MDLSNLFGGFNWSGGRPEAQANTGRAPSYNMNDGSGQQFLGMGMGAMNAGRLDNGVAAFMDPTWSEIPTGVFNQGIDGPGAAEVRARTMANNDPLGQLFNAMGKNASAVDSGQIYDGTGRSNGISNMYRGAQDELKDYWKVKTASAGWDGKNDPRGMATTTYQNNGGIWNPINAPQYYSNPKNPGWVKGEGSELVAAASMMLPAVGGWAGLANTVAPGVTSGMAGAIGNGATNALINAAGNTLMSGGNLQSFGTNLLSGAASSGASSLMGGSGLSNIFGNNTATLGSPSSFNSLSQYLGSGAGQAFRNSAPMRGEMGQLLNTGRSLSSLFGRFA